MIPDAPKIATVLGGVIPYNADATADVAALHGEGTATATDVLTPGSESIDNAFTVQVPVAAGGTNIVYTVIAKSTGYIDDPAPGATEIHYAASGTAAVRQANLIKALNGTSDNALVYFGFAAGATSGIAGVRAVKGSGTKVTIKSSKDGVVGNDTEVISTVGGTLVDNSKLSSGKLAGGSAETGYDESAEAVEALVAGYATDAAEAKKLEHARKVVLGYI